MNKHIYISIDGPNFSGKSTLVDKLSKEFTKLNLAHLIVGGIDKNNSLGELIHNSGRLYKSNPVVNKLLIAAEKHFTYSQKIQPLLSNGVAVISDRYLITCLAYDFLYDTDPNFTWSLYEKLPKANFLYALTAPVEILIDRMRLRTEQSHTELMFSRETELQAFERATTFLQSKQLNISIIDTSKLELEQIVNNILNQILKK